jgi:hypothetical protein
MRHDTPEIDGTGPGTRHTVAVLRYGTAGARPKVYVQGGLHADEAPGMIVARALIDALGPLEAAGAIVGEIVVVPAANPIGLNQRVLGTHPGRFDLGDGVNFNRAFPDLAPAVAERVAGRLTDDAHANVAQVRAALADAVAALAPATPAARLKVALLGLALDADLVLDLHCDAEAEVHLYTLPTLGDRLVPLTARLGAVAVLTAEVSGHNPFDEAVSRPWVDLAAAFPDHPLPQACASVTVELRGAADVAGPLAARDAAAILDALADLGALRGAPAPAPAPLCVPTPLSGSQPLKAPAAGIVVYRMPLGASAVPGDTVAEILDPVTGVRTPVTAATAGILYARASVRIAEIGTPLGKIAGAEPLRDGLLLEP